MEQVIQQVAMILSDLTNYTSIVLRTRSVQYNIEAFADHSVK